MLDSDLAILFRMTTKYVNQVVKRNRDKFPKEFVFRLTGDEFENLRLQIATSNSGQGQRLGQRLKGGLEAGWENEQEKELVHTQKHVWEDRRGGRRHLPYVFTAPGMVELASVLKWNIED